MQFSRLLSALFLLSLMNSLNCMDQSKELKRSLDDAAVSSPKRQVLVIDQAQDSGTMHVQTLHEAAELGDRDVLEHLLAQSHDINQLDQNNKTPLYYAIANHQDEAVRYLLDQNADMTKECIDEAEESEMDSFKASPLHFAAKYGNTAAVRLLVERGMSVEHPSDQGTPLHCACKYGCMEVAQLLVSLGANMNSQLNEQATTPLHVAAAWCDHRMVEYLISVGAHVDSRDITAETPLHWWANSNNPYGRDPQTLSVLINAGAVIDATNDRGQTPLHLAAANGNECIIKLLLTKQPNVNAQDIHGYTALYYITALRRYKVTISKESRTEPSPLHFALNEGFECSDPVLGIRHLLRAGASVDKVDTLNNRPFNQLHCFDSSSVGNPHPGAPYIFDSPFRLLLNGTLILSHEQKRKFLRIISYYIRAGETLTVRHKKVLLRFLPEHYGPFIDSYFAYRPALINKRIKPRKEIAEIAALLFDVNVLTNPDVLSQLEDWEYSDENGKNLLMRAVEEDEDRTFIEYLLEHYCFLNRENPENRIVDQAERHAEVVRAIKPRDINFGDREGHTAFWYALQLNNEALFNRLMEKGATPDWPLAISAAAINFRIATQCAFKIRHNVSLFK